MNELFTDDNLNVVHLTTVKKGDLFFLPPLSNGGHSWTKEDNQVFKKFLLEDEPSGFITLHLAETDATEADEADNCWVVKWTGKEDGVS